MLKQVLTAYKKDKINNVCVTNFTKQIIFNTEKAESDAIIILLWRRQKAMVSQQRVIIQNLAFIVSYETCSGDNGVSRAYLFHVLHQIMQISEWMAET